MKGGPDLIIFDMDGVLVDSEPLANRVFAEHLAGIGIPMPYEEVVRDLVGLSLISCAELIERRFGRSLPEDFLDRLQEATFARYRQGLPRVPHVEVALEAAARSGRAICLASSSAPDKIDLSLELTDLAGYFGPHLFSASQVARGKPHPDLFLHAAREMERRLGRKFAHPVVVEDSIPGVRAGRAAGMRVLGYAGGEHCGRAALAGAGAELFDDMRALPALLGIA